MITVTCQYTGFEFEANSKRSKNHPQVAAFLNEASKNRFKNGAYAKAKSLLSEAKGQFDTVEELMEAVQAAYSEWCDSGDANITVKSFKQRQAEARNQINAWFRKEDALRYEERTDGNAYSGPASGDFDRR